MAENRYSSITINLPEKDFPLSGIELKNLVYNIWVFPIAINEPEKFATWVEMNKKEAEIIDKLITWSTKVHEHVNAVKKETS